MPHTPGPWIHNGDVIENKGLDIIACRGAYAHEVVHGSHYEAKDWEANAALIARAPEIPDLEAEIARLREVNATLDEKCERVIVWLDRLAVSSESHAIIEANIANAQQYRAAAKEIRVAIAKARGEG